MTKIGKEKFQQNVFAEIIFGAKVRQEIIDEIREVCQSEQLPVRFYREGCSIEERKVILQEW